MRENLLKERIMIQKVLSIHKSNYSWVLPLLMLPVWILIYKGLHPFSEWITNSVFHLSPGTHLTESISFFVFEVPKVLLLLVLVVYVVGVLQSYFSPEKTRKLLEGKSLFTGNILASILGIITPFCSCSAIPLFLGFVEAGVPLGVTFSFLIAAPMINEVALVLLAGLFGWKVAVIYVVTGLVIAMLSGWLIGIFKLEKYVAEWVYQVKSNHQDDEDEKLTFTDRINAGYRTVKEIVGKIWLYIVFGVAVGAGAHGYVPADFLSGLLGSENWYSVPLAILIGVPLYSNAAGIIPIVSVLMEKGVSLGTALAFMMSVIALSLPEIIILKKVLKIQLISIFVGIVAIGIIVVGFIFNMLV